MRPLIEFLLTRMDTHPEEFLQNRKADVKHNWMHEIKDNKKFFTPEELEAVWSKLSDINMDRAMSQVTEKLFEPERDSWDDAIDAVKHHMLGKGVNHPTKMVVSPTQLKMIQQQYQLYQEKQKAEIEMEIAKLGGLNESSPY